jgi:quercetin dioxygenase-like cupin family protein
MGNVRIHSAEEIKWTTIRERGGDPAPTVYGYLAESELDSSMTFHEFGNEKELQLAELNFIPGAEAVIHKHDNDEIIYIVSGEMHFGNKVLKAGSSIYIQGNTFYGFTAGPEGLRVVNFRATADVSFHPKNP